MFLQHRLKHFRKSPDICLICVKDLRPFRADHFFCDTVHIQVHGTAAFCRRIHRAVDITDRADDEFVHIAVAYIEILQVVCNALIDFHCLLQIRVSVRNKVPLTDPVEITHAAVSSAFYADILPQVIVA